MLSLNTIKKSSGTRQKNKRVGRGNASGHGTYSTRGQKGQKSRSGVTGLKRLGMKKQLLQIPKSRGFRSLQPKNQVVSVSAINSNFKNDETVSPETLLAKKMINSSTLPVKILGKEKLTVTVKFDKIKMSEGLKSQIK
ncbi:50S ribosomal protein L15 [Candidatus Falkowbacteria bacterium]|uniref:Large ribosomal subunit protein uL15 n=1 Tax=Candidatus Falkowbacteria bacterium CG10_big_fil_rev_8_21_14_0_10_37_18 TaxID=1974562 RepID=A0A2H0V8S3_9BACT|nr:50S ribosomal protein L15 [Candidatus Falkowbacteria bacterium]NCQ12528.1 50S ribosomal protein L15 [Candidatus Falkowbacteria bacterium]OIO05994.1 MAG: 50S ribosomal protein L15 [Candidatus Falkowbacteria bacterium CG1_02_37_21]PIR95514.1 MAG: 50S ribosomal protein L15 [Candidatus Falkowbacteria bacterium CG10_big_fil_rev_8_21_14_0_10_37_18]